MIGRRRRVVYEVRDAEDFLSGGPASAEPWPKQGHWDERSMSGSEERRPGAPDWIVDELDALDRAAEVGAGRPAPWGAESELREPSAVRSDEVARDWIVDELDALDRDERSGEAFADPDAWASVFEGDRAARAPGSRGRSLRGVLAPIAVALAAFLVSSEIVRQVGARGRGSTIAVAPAVAPARGARDAVRSLAGAAHAGSPTTARRSGPRVAAPTRVRPHPSPARPLARRVAPRPATVLVARVALPAAPAAPAPRSAPREVASAAVAFGFER